MKDLQVVDNLIITILVDNVIEWSGSETHDNVMITNQWVKGKKANPIHVFGGHGLAFLIQTQIGENTYEILYDTGPSGEIISHNIEALGLDISGVAAIVMSHGHWDHFGGLLEVLKKIGHKNVPVHIHPRMMALRRTAAQTEQGMKIINFPSVPTLDEIKSASGTPVISIEPVLLAGNTILRTGEIPRRNDYEIGFPNHQALVDGKWIDDSKVIDDNCLAILTKEGLVIVTGCAHSGIVNSIHEAINLTGEKRVRAVIGGFHLMGKNNAIQIEKTIKDLKDISPKMLVPCHCTGAPAQYVMNQEFPKAYVTGSTGNRYVF
ncbi:MBL fold metallo-hydrolase [Candidatus Thorarchaeota archaeon]|nr:MAG: MBL fold metallo-hydrolase [Candidatus Thorarchaeota archaeon]